MKRFWAGFCLLTFFLQPFGYAASDEEKTLACSDQASDGDCLLTLKYLYELALDQSEKIALGREEIEKTEAQFLQAASEALGDVSLIMSHTWQEDQGRNEYSGSFLNPYKGERRIFFSQPIFQGFKAYGALRGAGSLRKQRKAELRWAESLLFEDVTAAFYALLYYRKDLELIKEISALFDKRLEELTERERIGRSRTSELVSARSRKSMLLAEQARVQGLLDVMRYMLEFLTGIDIDPTAVVDDDLAKTPVYPLDEHLKKTYERPDVSALEQSRRVAWQNVIVTQSGLWPKATLEHNQYLDRTSFQSGIDWDLLIRIDVPIFQGTGAVGRLKDAWSEWNKSKLHESLGKREAGLETSQAYSKWLHAKDEYAALEIAVKDADENYKLQEDEYRRNLVSNLDVLAALQGLFEARRSEQEVFYRMKNHYWGLQVASGALPRELLGIRRRD
ncbi:MAG: TolC family protein [Candidatus Omnitrophota bacterium]